MKTRPGTQGTGRVGTCLLISSLMMAVLLIAPASRAADEASVLRARAAQLASRDECRSALALLEQAAALDPAGEDEVAVLEGRCLLSLQEYDRATQRLERAVALDPGSGEAALALGMSRYHQGNLAGARSELERAEALLPERPEAQLYLGLILLSREEAAAAAQRLERASRLNADSFEPVSNYYSAIAHAGAGDDESAEAALRRVEALAPGTVWAQRASQALAEAQRRRENPELLRWLTIQAGIDYDSNIALRSDKVTQPDNISNDEDARGWWALDTGTELFRRDGWAGGIGANYNGSHPFQEQDFDQHFASASLWLDRTLGEKTLLRISPEGGFGFFDGDEYLRFVGVQPELRHEWGRAGRGSFYGRYAYNDFRFDDIPGASVQENRFRDRDGHDILGGYDHQIRISERTDLRGGIFARHYIAEGGEFDHTGGGGWLGIQQSLPLGLVLDLTGSVAYDVYDTESSFRQDPPPLGQSVESDHEREDLVSTAGAVLARRINDWLSVAARYQYLDNDSNTRVFDYDRHIVGAFVTIGLIQ